MLMTVSKYLYSEPKARIWDSQSGELRGIIKASNPQVNVIACSSDCQTIALGSPGEIQLCNVHSFRIIKTLRRGVDPNEFLIYSPDGAQIATNGYNNKITLWDVKAGQVINRLDGCNGRIRKLAYSPDGQLIASLSAIDGLNRVVSLWNIKSGQLISTWDERKQINDMVYNPCTQVIALGCGDGTVKFWDVQENHITQTLKVGENSVTDLAYSPNGNVVVARSSDGKMLLWSTKNEKTLKTFIYPHRLKSLAYRPDGKIITTASGDIFEDSYIQFLHADSGKTLMSTEEKNIHPIRTLIYTPDGQSLVSLSGGRVQFWDTKSGELQEGVDKNGTSIYELTYLACDNYFRVIILKGTEKYICLIDAKKNKEIMIFDEYDSKKLTLKSMAYGPDGKTVAASFTENRIFIYDVKNGHLLNTIEVSTGEKHSIAYSPDGKIIAIGSELGMVCLWSIEPGSKLKIAKSHKSQPITSIAYSPDGQSIAVASGEESYHDLIVELWDLRSDDIFQTLSGHIGKINTLVYSPDSKVIASGSFDDSTVRIWTTLNGKLIKVLGKYCFEVLRFSGSEFTNGGRNSLCFSPDSNAIAIGLHNGEIGLWDLYKDEIHTYFYDSPKKINTLSYDENNETIIFGTEDGSMKFWDVRGNRKLTQSKDLTSNVIKIIHSPTENVIALLNYNHSPLKIPSPIELRNSKTGSLLTVIEQSHTDKYFTALAYEPKGKVIVVASTLTRPDLGDFGFLSLYCTQNGRRLKTFYGSSRWSIAIRRVSWFLPIIFRMLLPSNFGWFLGGQSRTLSKSQKLPKELISVLTYSPNGNIIAVGGIIDNSIYLLDANGRF